MSKQHGPPLDLGKFARLAGVMVANIPRDLDPDLADEFSGNGDALAVVLAEGLTRENLDQALAALGKKDGDIIAPPGGRIHVLRVPVILDQPWQEAVRAAGPSTPDNCDVWGVGDLYPPIGIGIKDVKIVLVNFGPNGGNLAKAIAWAKQYNLKRTNPRQVFAIGEHEPQLYKKLEMDSMYMVATKECSFGGRQQVCSVWWLGAGRRAGLDWTGLVGCPGDWFAFVRE